MRIRRSTSICSSRKKLHETRRRGALRRQTTLTNRLRLKPVLCTAQCIVKHEIVGKLEAGMVVSFGLSERPTIEAHASNADRGSVLCFISHPGLGLVNELETI